jgi:hypothetical protein
MVVLYHILITLESASRGYKMLNTNEVRYAAMEEILGRSRHAYMVMLASSWAPFSFLNREFINLSQSSPKEKT